MKPTLKYSPSAEVDMWLDCGNYGLLPLNRISPESVCSPSPRDIPPCIAELVVTVDGLVIRNRVNLTAGFSRNRESALALAVDDIAPF
jgi:hypothetical protein